MNIFTGILNLFLPTLCRCCGEKIETKELLCSTCKNGLIEYHSNSCTFCGTELTNSHICSRCKEEYFFDEVYSGYTYGSVMQKLIHDFKYNEFKKNGFWLAHNFGERLISTDMISKLDYIVPVPLHRTKKRGRGFNQSDIIADALSQSINIPVLKNVIVRKKFTKTQTLLKKEEREQNVSQAFWLRNPEVLKHKSVVLVDDVLTTGSTMKSIALLLRENLINKVYVATLARA
ncbi:MAG TPA: ComF family protein [Candidatus Cloacimonetes bacterium]|nr:ComF family protein [Candidatus Cloacimonadota bacterium]HEX37663.1 ComF family protein [Candidatus Cloacimonadota bacterium]